MRIQRDVHLGKQYRKPGGSQRLMGPCYMEDDQTVGNVGTGASLAGIVLAVDEDGITVEQGCLLQ